MLRNNAGLPYNPEEHQKAIASARSMRRDFVLSVIASGLTLAVVAYLHREPAPLQTFAKGGSLLLYKDQLTGCQYLGTTEGGLTPRLSHDGKPICIVERIVTLPAEEKIP